MKRIVALILVLVTLILCVAAHAISYGMVNDPGSNVNLRSAPNMKQNNVLVGVPHGEYVTIYGQSGNWYEVEYNGYRGYIHKTKIILQPSYNGSSSGNQSVRYYTAKSKLSTRTGPGTDYDGFKVTEDFFGYENQSVKVLSAVYSNRDGIWWIQVEVEKYGQLMRMYTGAKRFYNIDVNYIPKEYVMYSAYVTSDVYPFYGPGSRYAQHNTMVEAWTYGDVITTENGYAQFEYQLNGYKHRCWIPESKLR